MGNSTDESQILELFKKWISAVKSQDVSTITDILPDEIIIFDGDVGPLIGKKQVVKYFEDTFHLFERDLVLESYEIVVSKSGDLANGWMILDNYLDGKKVGRVLYSVNWLKKSGVWYATFINGNNVDLNWTM